MLRLFLAIPLPDATADRLLPFQSGLPGARWSSRANLHLTLRFLGEIDERLAEDVDAELGEIEYAPFRLSLFGAGLFGGEDPHTAYIGVRENPELDDLHRRVERAVRNCGLPPDPRNWKPHVTIAYLRGTTLHQAMAFEANAALFEAPPFDVTAFEMWSSTHRQRGGSHYESVATYPLIAPALEDGQ
jgi:RNA 2',3'-cyclic 3'-phosphodiesterase